MTIEELNKLKSLIDSALPIIELFECESVAQKQWKQQWIDNARSVLDGVNRDNIAKNCKPEIDREIAELKRRIIETPILSGTRTEFSPDWFAGARDYMNHVINILGINES